jgi:hypothetical protein
LKRLRIIEQLRAEFGGIWSYDSAENAWSSADGKKVVPFSHLAPLTPNGDDHCVTQYWRVDVNPHEQVSICRQTCI